MIENANKIKNIIYYIIINASYQFEWFHIKFINY